MVTDVVPEQLSDSPVCHLHLRTHPASRCPTTATLSTQALSPEWIIAQHPPHRNNAIQHPRVATCTLAPIIYDTLGWHADTPCLPPMRRPVTQFATPNVDVCWLSVMRKLGPGVNE